MDTKNDFVKVLTIDNNGWRDDSEMELVNTLTSDNSHPENYYG
jgi:hypothetical protein